MLQQQLVNLISHLCISQCMRCIDPQTRNWDNNQYVWISFHGNQNLHFTIVFAEFKFWDNNEPFVQNLKFV